MGCSSARVSQDSGVGREILDIGDYEQVHVAVAAHLAAGGRPEQDDALRLGDLNAGRWRPALRARALRRSVVARGADALVSYRFVPRRVARTRATASAPAPDPCPDVAALELGQQNLVAADLTQQILN